MKRFFHEPLLHFLLLGSLLFLGSSWWQRRAPLSDQARQVHIGAGEVKWLQECWRRQWQREPTPEELRTLLSSFLREELLAREARTLKLDENDTFIRRCLANKMEFLIKDTAGLAQPTEADLHQFYEANRERFQTEARVSFAHVFFSRERRADALADARAALSVLATGQRAADEVGDPGPMTTQWVDADSSVVASQFGREFADTLAGLREPGWHGPIASPYGVHLVQVSQRQPARQRDFMEVRALALERWREAHERAENDKYFAGLLKRYDVTVDPVVHDLTGRWSAQEAMHE